VPAIHAPGPRRTLGTLAGIDTLVNGDAEAPQLAQASTTRA